MIEKSVFVCMEAMPNSLRMVLKWKNTMEQSWSWIYVHQNLIVNCVYINYSYRDFVLLIIIIRSALCYFKTCFINYTV